MQYFPIVLVLAIVLFFIVRPITVLIHELGHAVPAMLFTKQKATIYIGSYGDPKKSGTFTIGLLEVWYRYNPLFWMKGLCMHSGNGLRFGRNIVCTLSGPLASFMIAVAACYFTFLFDLHGMVKFTLIIFLCSAIFDLIVNLIPNSTPVRLYNGNIAYNDGYSIKRQIYFKRNGTLIDEALAFFDKQRYLEALVRMNKILKSSYKDANLCRLAIYANLHLKNFSEAKRLQSLLEWLSDLSADDCANAGLAYGQLGGYNKALAYFEQALSLTPSHPAALNNKAYALILLKRYMEAKVLLDQAISLDAEKAYAYNNRGLAKLKMGAVEAGLQDIHHSLQLDKDNSYAYRNLGNYHLERGEFDEALSLFQKAKGLDWSTHLIDELIDAAVNKVRTSPL